MTRLKTRCRASAAADWPCTAHGKMRILMLGNRRLMICQKSFNAARRREEVMTPMRCSKGDRPLILVKSPRRQVCFDLLKALNAPSRQRILRKLIWYSPRTSYTVRLPKPSILSPF